MRFGIEERLLQNIAKVFSQESAIDEVRVFGSRARGDYKNGSDVDMAIFAPELSFEGFLLVRAALDDLPILFKLDTVHFDTIGTPVFKESILKEGVPFYRRESTDTPYQEERLADQMFVREDLNGPPSPT